MRFLPFQQQTAIISLNKTNLFVLLMKEQCVFCKVRTEVSNRELEEMSKGENVVKWIKGQRISWLGNLERMEEDRMPKKIFTQELEGTRRRGRPRKGWKDEVQRDLQVMGMRRWTKLGADRKKWKDIARQAKTHSGP